ncbi:MAG: hypothetical protein MJK04_31060, partial [Psychrosphaera sp.]|nr:hypothetical protein [Psychrosphaera sp.]
MPPHRAFVGVVYEMLENKHNDQSIATFIYASEIYPNSANVFDSLAEALSAVQRHKEAKVAMEKAVALGTANHHYNLAYFKEHLAPV